MSPAFEEPIPMNRVAYAAAAMSALIAVSTSAAPAIAASRSKESASPSTAAAASTISCPGDTTVWVNTRSKAYHVQSDSLFGRAKHGKFECKKAADAEIDHLAEGK
jgi:hypothetical protein